MRHRWNSVCREGDCVAVPLRGGGFALAVVARSNGQGILLGYFFGPRRSSLPGAADVGALNPEDAALVRRVSALGITKGAWPILFHLPGWDRAQWPIPRFARLQPEDGMAWIVEYGEKTLQSVREVRVSLDAAELRGLPEDGLSGYLAAEVWVNRSLAST